jgi:hypothetical protein
MRAIDSVVDEITMRAFRETFRNLLQSSAGAMIAAAMLATPLGAQDYLANKPPPSAPTLEIPLTPQEKAQLAAVDIRLAAVEALVSKIDDPAFKSSTVSAIADIKKRRAAIEKKFDPAGYETLMHLVIGRYQIVALWLEPPRIPGPAQKPATTAEAKSESKSASR